MSDEQDLTEATEAAWVSFRGRLADHVAEMIDDDVLVVEYADRVEEDDETGAAPYVQVCAFEDGWVQVEAASNAYLDEAAALGPAQESLLLELGWQQPTDEPGWGNFHETSAQREADRVAVLLVRTLREVYGAPHPAFLLADGLELDPAAEGSTHGAAPEAAEPERHEVAFPRGPEHLKDLVDEAMRKVFPDLKHDGDGDIPIIAGRSVVFVRVVADRPAVEVYAEIVLDPDDHERVPLELELLNRAQPLWKFTRHDDDRVVMRHEVVAVPFVGHLLRAVVHRFVEDVDAIAADLVARVGGHRFADPADTADTAGTDGPSGPTVVDDGDLALVGLLELLHLGRPRAATVAGLFDHDRTAIIRQIVRIRTGQQPCDGHHVDDVLTALRKALRLVSDGEPRPSSGPGPSVSPRSVQQSLLSDDEVGEEALDLGWTA